MFFRTRRKGGVPVTLTDAYGDAVEVTWSLKGEEVQIDPIPAGDPTSGAELEYTASLPLGVNTLAVTATVTDTCGETTWKTVSISSNEAEGVIGSGNTAPDWEIKANDTANLRAERSGTNKSGRVYTITIEATDASGNVSEPAEVTVTAPHSKGKPGSKSEFKLLQFKF